MSWKERIIRSLRLACKRFIRLQAFYINLEDDKIYSIHKYNNVIKFLCNLLE